MNNKQQAKLMHCMAAPPIENAETDEIDCCLNEFCCVSCFGMLWTSCYCFETRNICEQLACLVCSHSLLCCKDDCATPFVLKHCQHNDTKMKHSHFAMSLDCCKVGKVGKVDTSYFQNFNQQQPTHCQSFLQI